MKIGIALGLITVLSLAACTNENDAVELSGTADWKTPTETEISEIAEFWTTAPESCEDIRPPVQIRGATREYAQCKGHFDNATAEQFLIANTDNLDWEALRTNPAEQKKAEELVAAHIAALEAANDPAVASKLKKVGMAKAIFTALGRDVSGSEGMAWLRNFVG